MRLELLSQERNRNLNFRNSENQGKEDLTNKWEGWRGPATAIHPPCVLSRVCGRQSSVLYFSYNENCFRLISLFCKSEWSLMLFNITINMLLSPQTAYS